MPTVGELISDIMEYEQIGDFSIEICSEDQGKAANNNKNISGSPYRIKTDGSISLVAWSEQFTKLYPGYILHVLKGKERVNRRTLLDKIRK